MLLLNTWFCLRISFTLQRLDTLEFVSMPYTTGNCEKESRKKIQIWIWHLFKVNKSQSDSSISTFSENHMLGEFTGMKFSFFLQLKCWEKKYVQKSNFTYPIWNDINLEFFWNGNDFVCSHDILREWNWKRDLLFFNFSL